MIMKKIRKSAGLLLLILTMMFSMTACFGGGSDNGGSGTGDQQNTQQQNTDQQSQQQKTDQQSQQQNTQQQNTQQQTTQGQGQDGSAQQESSTGVIDGLMDDVSQGMDDMTGETRSSAADEAR